MAASDSDLGTCPACKTPLVRNNQSRTVMLAAVAPPANAYYPELRFALRVAWCPACGWVKSVEWPQLGMAWRNDEYDQHGD